MSAHGRRCRSASLCSTRTFHTLWHPLPSHPVVMSASTPPGSAVELQILLAKFDNSTPATYSLASELLAFLAAQHIHAPKLVVKYGKQLILHHRGKLGDRGRTDTPQHSQCALTISRPADRSPLVGCSSLIAGSVGYVRASTHRSTRRS